MRVGSAVDGCRLRRRSGGRRRRARPQWTRGQLCWCLWRRAADLCAWRGGAVREREDIVVERRRRRGMLRLLMRGSASEHARQHCAQGSEPLGAARGTCRAATALKPYAAPPPGRALLPAPASCRLALTWTLLTRLLVCRCSPCTPVTGLSLPFSGSCGPSSACSCVHARSAAAGESGGLGARPAGSALSRCRCSPSYGPRRRRASTRTRGMAAGTRPQQRGWPDELQASIAGRGRGCRRATRWK